MSLDINAIRQPTSDECSAHAVIAEDDEEIAVAVWYPQMGGYGGHAVAIFSKPSASPETDGTSPCFECAVWHDGEFPFSDDNDRYSKGPRRVLHHCDASQFVRFGNDVLGAMLRAGWTKATE